MNKSQLQMKQAQLRNELTRIEKELSLIESLERPFKAAISSHGGLGNVGFKTEEKARKKYEQYCKKYLYRGGTTHGAYLYKVNEDGSKTLLDYQPINTPDFYPYEFDKVPETV